MSRARDNADGARLDAPLASPAFTGTPTGITGTHITSGTLGNTVQDNITRLGTVTSGVLEDAVTYRGINQDLATTDSPTFASITGANQLTGISYTTTTNANGNWVTVANNTSYICYIHEGGGNDQQEIWTAVVDGSGAVTATELKAETTRYTLGTSTNGVRFGYSSGTVQKAVMLVFENANADIT